MATMLVYLSIQNEKVSKLTQNTSKTQKKKDLQFSLFFFMMQLMVYQEFTVMAQKELFFYP